MTYTVMHYMLLQGVTYRRGDTITSEQIGRDRLETALRNMNRIVPRKDEPDKATSAPQPEQASLVFEPTKHKGGRPRRET